jgi:mannose-6-phosphate isomerase
MYPLENRVKEYAWGSKTAIAELLGQPSPSSRPQAELWMGAHPSAPSSVRRGEDWQSLLDLIKAEPDRELGPRVIAKFGPKLPFLFKVLAAETPLSLQAHPNMDQARTGFAQDEEAKIPIDAPQRNYKDASHKPELICALGPFEALSGFRRANDTLRLLNELHVVELAPGVTMLEREPDARGTRALFSWLMGHRGPSVTRLVEATIEACQTQVDTRGAFTAECEWALRLGTTYPGDIGVVVALLLNLIVLQEGQAIYLPAGNLHAYLRGVGIEIMANSDNVLRGGLTPKHVDVPELLRVLTFSDGPVSVLTARIDGLEKVYDTPASEFCLSRIDIDTERTFRAAKRRGPEILLCMTGTVTARAIEGSSRVMHKGDSIFVPANAGSYDLGGAGSVFRATVGDL